MVQKRNIVTCIILSLVTCGIYGLYWFVCITDDTNAIIDDPNGTSGIMAVILTIVTCGFYGWYWAYKCGEKIDAAKANRGIPSSNSGILYIILFALTGGIVTYALIQNELNKLAD